MSLDTTFACVTADKGLVSEILPVSPVFVRCGPPARGLFPDRRLARARRSDARLAQRAPRAPQVPVDFSARCPR